MRVGVIRGDVPGPIGEPGRLFLADLEPTSQFSPPTEPFGQTRYISRPDPIALANYLAGVYPSDISGMDGGITPSTPPTLVPIPTGQPFAGGVPAGVESSAAVTFPVTVPGGGLTLQVANVNPPGYVVVTVAPAGATYNTMAQLLAGINAVLVPTGVAVAVADATGTLVVIKSSISGVGSYINVGAAGTFNTLLHLAAPVPAASFTIPSATTIITALNPVIVPPATGSINVSAANILATLGAAPSAAQVANFIAPQFKETEVAVQSFQVGNLSKFLELTWNPDPRRLPAIANGPAIQVVQDDGVSAFTAPLPKVTAAAHNVPNAGDITITGVGLGNVEYNYPVQPEPGAGTVVTVRAAAATSPGSGAGVNSIPKVKLTQRLISGTTSGGTTGTVTATSIVIPASLLNALNGAGGTVALGVAGSVVEVKYETFANSNYGTAANIASTAVQPYIGADGSIREHVVVTITGLTNIQASQVGQPIVISGAASFANNGEFIIQSVVSAASVTIFNDAAVAPDTNNGAISWSTPGPVLFPVS